MANYGPSSAFLLVGGRNISGDTPDMEESVEQVLQQSNGLGDANEEFLPVGLGKVTLDAGAGIYDDRTAGMVDALQSQGTTRQLIAWGFGGADCRIMDGTYVNVWNRMAKADGLTMGKAKHGLTGTYSPAKVIHGVTAETAASGNTQGANAVDNATSSANGVTADLHVPAYTSGGATSLTVKLRHSTDNSSYVDLITFTNVTAVATSERKTQAGTINRYLAMSWLFNGSPSGQSAVPFVAAVRG